MKRCCCILSCLLLCCTAFGQSNKLIKQLEAKRGNLQKEIAETESLLRTTKKDVVSQLQGLNTLNGQIEKQKQYIDSLNADVQLMGTELDSLQSQLVRLEDSLNIRRKHYGKSLQYLYRNRNIHKKLMFLFSAKSLDQTMRRVRYIKEYAAYQKLQGKAIMERQAAVNAKRDELQQVKQEQDKVLQSQEAEKRKLERQEAEKRAMVQDLQKKQRDLQQEINKKRKESSQLNARIDYLINQEIEKARKRAEEEARKKAAAEAKARAAEAKKNKSAKAKRAESSKSSGKTTAKPMERYMTSRADVALSSNFSQNRGRLPMPISGSYIITSHYGQYAVEGMRNVRLDNKGIDIQGRPGAMARAVFDGKVAAVFQLNGLFNVLVRHGSYISVYCNLSNAYVKTGDTVKTKQNLGQVFSDSSHGGRTVLHFQLRKEKEKLNPESWLRR